MTFRPSRAPFVSRLGPALLIAIATATTALVAQQWSERGPVIGGRLSAIVAADLGRTLVAASPGGGVWRSVDGGAHWTFPANGGAADHSFVHLEWDLANARRLFGLTWNGLYASADRAESWSALINPGGVPAPLGPEQSTVADPRPFAQMRLSATERVVLAAVPCSGLYYSFDGVAFTQHWPFPNGAKNPDNCLGTIVADPVSRRVYFSTLARGRTAHVFRSDCGAQAWAAGRPCLTWTPASQGLPVNSVVSAMVSVSEPGSPDHLVLQTVGAGSSLLTFLTTDGSSWQLQSTQERGWAPRVLLHPAPGPGIFEGFVGFGYSSDLGVTWQPLNVPRDHPDHRAIYADVGAGKLWVVNDGSMSGNYANIVRWDWKPGKPPVAGSGVDLGHDGLSIWQVYYAAVVPSSGGRRRVFAGSQDNASLCADDVNGESWTPEGAAPTGGDSFVFQVAPSDPNRAYAWANNPLEFARTSNAASAARCGAVVWTRIHPRNAPPGKQLIGSNYWSRHDMAVHPTDPNRLYFALANGLGVAANAGGTEVEVVHRELPNRYRSSVVHVDAQGAVYLGTMDHGVFRSTDDGQTWTPWGLNENSPAMVTAITGGAGRTPVLWMATTSGVYQRAPTDADWTRVIDAPGYTASDVEVDRACPSRVYVAYGFAGVRGQHRGGIQVTSDGGATWTSITSGEVIHNVPVTAVQVDPQQPRRLYAATYGRGFWVFDWGTALPACNGRAPRSTSPGMRQ